MDEQPSREPVTHAPHRRAPYVRATLTDGTVLDGKAAAWTSTRVLVDWYNPDSPAEVVAGIEIHMHSQWIPADRVQRIKRRDSAWQDVYDDYEWYEEQGEL